MSSVNIWLDDMRVAPEGWVHLHNIEEVEFLVRSSRGLEDFYIDKMSYDFHLNHPKLGIDVMKYLADLCVKEKTKKYWAKTILYHSNDVNGIEIMRSFAESFEKEILPENSE